MRTRWGLWSLMLGFAAACLIYLVIAPSPWSEGLDTSREVKESIRTRSWVVIGLWVGAAINLILSIAALLCWNFRPAMIDSRVDIGSSAKDEATSLLVRWGRGFLVLLAVFTAAWVMWPRLALGLWGDEDATTRRFLIGHVYRMEDDSFVVKPPSWEKTIWNYDTGTNSHLLFNVLGRLCHGPADTSGTDPDAFYFDPAKIRLPSFIATLLMLPAAAWLLCLLGFPRGAPLAAFLLAFHPWIVRFGSDARGYALQMLFGVLALGCLVKGLSVRRARWWLGFGIAQFLMIASNLSSIYLLVPMNAVALWLAWAPSEKGHANPFKVANVWRYGGGTLVGAMLTLQIMMPQALQLPGFLKGGRLKGELPDEVFTDWIANWLLGSPWHEWNLANPFSISWQDLLGQNALLTWGAAGLIGLLIVGGAIAFLARSRTRWWILALLTPAPLMLADAIRSGNILYPWYTIGFLPLALLVAGAGYSAVCGRFQKRSRTLGEALSLGLGLLIVGLFVLATREQRELYRHHPVEPTGEAVRLTREVVNPFHPEIDRSLTLGFVHASRLYDPAMIMANDDEAFIEGIRRAEKLEKPLWVNAANLGVGPAVFPRAMGLIEDREVFEEPQVIYGLQGACTRFVFRYKPGGLARFEARQAKLSPTVE